MYSAAGGYCDIIALGGNTLYSKGSSINKSSHVLSSGFGIVEWVNPDSPAYKYIWIKD